MDRIRLELPKAQQFIFRTEITPRISDINYGNHLGHDRIISLTHEARVRFLQNYNFSEIDVDGVGIIMADLAITYKAEVSWGESLNFNIAIYAPKNSGCNFFYHIKNAKTGAEVARAKTGIVFFDYKKRKIARMPAAFAKLFPS